MRSVRWMFRMQPAIKCMPTVSWFHFSSPAYRAALGTNGNFLLMHSVGSIPHNSEIDVPLNYADYYYLEALKRKRDIEKGL